MTGLNDMVITPKKKLKPGEVRNLINFPDMYGHKVTIDGKRVTFTPTVEVSVYKDRWGRYTVVDKGHRLTAQEKKLGLRRTRTKEAQFIKREFENSPYSHLRKLTQLKGKSSRQYPRWEVDGVKGWVNLSKVGKPGKGGIGKADAFIGKQMIGRKGEMEVLMYSLSRTTFATEAGINLLDMWNKLTEAQKFAKMVELLNIDWDNFFDEYIDSDGIYSDDINMTKQEIGVNMIAEILQS